MSGSKKNPFEIFGLTPDLAGRLNDEDLFAVVKTLYRSLQKVYHPDRCRGRKQDKSEENRENTQRAVELNLAFEALNRDKNETSFRKNRKAYANRHSFNGLRKKIQALEKEIKAGHHRQSELADGFMDFLLGGLPWLPSNGAEHGRPFISPTNVKLGLNDVAINQNIRAVNWNLGSNYKEITFDALGEMLYRPVGRAQAFPVNYIHIIGTVDTGQLDILPLLNRVPPRQGCFKSPALDSRYGIDGAPLQVLNTMCRKKFKQYCLPILKPELRERSYLFSVHRPVFEQEGDISLEGVIVKISKL
jgi:hypothetical protein